MSHLCQKVAIPMTSRIQFLQMDIRFNKAKHLMKSSKKDRSLVIETNYQGRCRRTAEKPVESKVVFDEVITYVTTDSKKSPFQLKLLLRKRDQDPIVLDEWTVDCSKAHAPPFKTELIKLPIKNQRKRSRLDFSIVVKPVEMRPMNMPSGDVFKALFHQFDQGGKGYLTSSEFSEMFHYVFPGRTDGVSRNLEVLLGAFDDNNDEKVQEGEWLQMIENLFAMRENPWKLACRVFAQLFGEDTRINSEQAVKFLDVLDITSTSEAFQTELALIINNFGSNGTISLTELWSAIGGQLPYM